MHTKIRLSKMRFYAFHGVMPQESITGHEFEVSLSLEADVTPALESDEVEDTINYACLFDLVKAEMMVPSRLIEHVAGRIFRKLKEQYPQLTDIEVRVAKLHPPVKGEVERAEVIVSS